MAGALPRALAAGTLPLAVAASLVELGGHGLDLAGARTTLGQAATSGAATVTRSGLVWAFTTAGQAAIPVLLVDALAGAVLGEMTAQALEVGVAHGIAAVRRTVRDSHHTVVDQSPRPSISAPTEATSHDEARVEQRTAGQPSPAVEVARLHGDPEQDVHVAAMLSHFEALLADDAVTLVLDPRPR